MPDVLRFPSPESNDRIHLVWPLRDNESRGFEFDVSDGDKRIHFESQQGGFLFEILLLQGRLIIDAKGEDPRELGKGGFMTFGDRPPVNFPNQMKFHVVFNLNGEIKVTLLNQEKGVVFMPDFVHVNELDMTDSWRELSEALNSTLHLDEVGKQVDHIIEMDPEVEIRRLGMFGDEPFCVSNGGSARVDRSWFDDLLSTNVIDKSRLNESKSEYKHSMSHVSFILTDGRVLHLWSVLRYPILDVQIEGMKAERVHKDMLAEYLMRNV